MATQLQVVIDSAHPGRLAEFWSAAIGYIVQPPPPGFATWPDFLRQVGVPEDRWETRSAAVDPDGRGPRIFFQQVPEAKAGKNRLHLDVQIGVGAEHGDRPALVRDEVTRLVALGAREIEVFEEMGEHWVVMADPEGNEFCVS